MAQPQKRTFKTKKVLSGVRTEYHAWKVWEEGDTLIGKLLGTSPNRKAKNRVDWIVEVIEPMFSDKTANKKLKAGTKVTLNTAGQFDKGMAQLEMGDIFQVTYNGSKEMVGGDYAGEQAHTMEVEQLEEEGEESDEDEDDSESDDEESDEDDEDDL